MHTNPFRTLVPVALLILPLFASAQVISRGPYLQTPTPASVIVKWRTDLPTDSAVRYGTDAGNLNQIASDAALVTDHEISLTGLSADTKYYYSVGTTLLPLAGDATYHVTTSPATGTAKDTRIWVIGDSGTADANAAAVRDAYQTYTGARGTDVWLMLGDNAYNTGNDAEYQAAVFDFYTELLRQTPLWSAYGNHDGIDVFFNPPGAYPQIFSFPTAGEAGGVASGSELYYSFDYGPIHFVVLDSTTNANRAAGSAMYTWLTNDLTASTQDWTIALWHHPHYSKGSHDSDAEVALQEMRANALPTLETHGVDLVLAGHSHSYERSVLVDGHYGASTTLLPAMILDGGDGNLGGDGAYVKPSPAGTANEGAVHAIVGSSGKTETGGTLDHPVMYTSLLTLGSMVIDISGNQLDAVFLDSTGTVQDEFTLIKNPPQLVSMNLKPWDETNSVEPASNNLLAVAILGSSVAGGDPVDFDATQVDPASLRLGIGEAANIAIPWISDVDADTHADLVVGFKTGDTGILCNDTSVGLTGDMLGGDSIVASDFVNTVDCVDAGCHP